MAARSLNKVMLIGNLTRDPELRFTPSGTAVCTFGVATNRQWTTESGEKKEEAEFHRIVAWQKLAEICSKFLSKGRKTYLEGRLQTRTWTGKDGQERQTTEIVISDMIILDSRRGEEVAASEAVSGTSSTAQPVSSSGQTKTASEDEEEEKEEKKKEKETSEEKKEKEEKVEPKDIPF